MNITQRLQDLDPTLVLHNEGDWKNPLDPTKTGFTSFNDAGIETETGEFLYSMVRILKPKHVLETGTHIAVGAAYMGTALKDNKEGHLDTLEFLGEIHQRAIKRMSDLGLQDFVTCHYGDAGAFVPNEGIKYQLMLLDTEPKTRFAEAVRFFDNLDDGGFMFIHDLHRHMAQEGSINPDHPNEPFWPWGELPSELKEFVKNGKLRPIHFPTPRGFMGFYKPHPQDYNWNISEISKSPIKTS